MPKSRQVKIALVDEECAIEEAWIETRTDGTQRYMCKMEILAYLVDGQELRTVGTFELYPQP
jgi:hypothetical protein